MSYWSRSFRGLAESLTEVRQFTAAVLGDRPGVDLVVLAASELSGNAVQHTASGEPGGQFVVHLAAFADRWQVRVDDAGGANYPQLSTFDAFDLLDGEYELLPETGRGLALVAAISHAWGVLGDQYARAVWAEIPHSPAAKAATGAETTDEAADEAVAKAAAEFEAGLERFAAGLEQQEEEQGSDSDSDSDADVDHDPDADADHDPDADHDSDPGPEQPDRPDPDDPRQRTAGLLLSDPVTFRPAWRPRGTFVVHAPFERSRIEIGATSHGA